MKLELNMKTASLFAVIVATPLLAFAQSSVFLNSNNVANPDKTKNVAANVQDSNAAGLELYTVNTNALIIDEEESSYTDGAYHFPDSLNIVTNKGAFWCLYTNPDVTGNPAASNTVINSTMEWSPSGSGVFSRFKVTLNADDINSFIYGGKVLQPVESAYSLNYASNSIFGVENVAAVNVSSSDGVYFVKVFGTNGVDCFKIETSSGLVTVSNNIVHRSQSYSIPVTQSGSTNISALTAADVVFAKVMPSTNYSVALVGANATLAAPIITARTTTGFSAAMTIFSGILLWTVTENTQ